MYRKYVHKGVTWYDFREINQDEAREVCSLYDLDSTLVKKILNVSTKDSATKYQNCILISLEIPCSLNTRDSQTIDKKPVHFVMGKDFLITVRFDDVRGFRELKKELPGDEEPVTQSLVILARLLLKVYEYMYHDLADELGKIAQEQGYHSYKKYLIEYRRTVARHEQVMETFRSVATHLYSDPLTTEALKPIVESYRSLNEKIDKQRHVYVDCLRGPEGGKKQKVISFLSGLLMRKQ